jgi:cell division protein FtsB
MSHSSSRGRKPRLPEGGISAARRLFPAAAAGFFAYCALSVLLGPVGLTAYAAAEKRMTAMEANLEALSSINKRLSSELESLKNDPDRAEAEARSLGYLAKGETAVLMGNSVTGPARIEVGEVLPFADPKTLEDPTIKAISLGIGMAVLAALLTPSFRASGPRRRYRDRLVQSASLE